MSKTKEIISTGYEPREHQIELHKRLKRFNVLVCHRRFGKSNDINTLVPTPKGMVKLIDIKTGDIVFNKFGNHTKVIRAHEPYIEQTYDIVFDSGIVINATGDHRWYVEPSMSTLCKTKRNIWDCGEVLQTQEISKLIEDGCKLFIPASPAQYADKELEIDPYWFGYWLGNGSKDCPSLYIVDTDNIEFKYTATSIGQRAGCKVYYYGKQNIKDSLRLLGVLNNKHIPTIYKTCSIEQRMQLIRGLMDSDGGVSASGTPVFDGSNEVLVRDVMEVLRSCGAKVSMSSYQRKGAIEHRLFISGINYKKLFGLKRKQDRTRDNQWLNVRHQIIDVVESDKRFVRCLTVDSPDHLYLISDGFIATHNTIFSINEMIDKGLRCENKNPRYAYIAPLYSQAKRIAWDYLKDYTRNIPGAIANEADLRVDIPHNGCRFMLLGADNPNSLRGIYLDGVILDEFAEMTPDAWTSVIRPALSDREGWAIFIGTPKGTNHFYDLYTASLKNDSWFTAMYKGEETNIIPKSELQHMRIEMDDAEYAQEIQCSFESSLVGAYYGKLIHQAMKENRICDLRFDPALRVNTAWDLGLDDMTAIWFWQEYGPRIHFIDYYEQNNVELPKIITEVRNRGYSFGTHYLPHDAKQRDMSIGESRERTIRRLITGSVFVLPREGVEDGIHAARLVLHRAWFDQTKCAAGVEALKSYQRKWNAKNKTFDKAPLHNWASHGADAFRYAAKGMQTTPMEDKELPRHAITAYDVL